MRRRFRERGLAVVVAASAAGAACTQGSAGTDAAAIGDDAGTPNADAAGLHDDGAAGLHDAAGPPATAPDGSDEGGGSVRPVIVCGSAPVVRDADGQTTLVDLGHASRLNALLRRGERVVTSSETYSSSWVTRWILWDTGSGVRLASGDGTASEAAGDLFTVTLPGRTEVRALTNGELAFQTSSALHLEGSGAFLYAVDSTGVTAFSRSGIPLLHVAGNYGPESAVVALPDEIRIIRGPAGADVVEAIAVPAGTKTISPAFSGTFHEWFTDGQYFMTTSGTVLSIYDKAARLVETVPKRGYGHHGSHGWYWSGSDKKLSFYRVGNGGVGRILRPGRRLRG
jgi:hypothetical protein